MRNADQQEHLALSPRRFLPILASPVQAECSKFSPQSGRASAFSALALRDRTGTTVHEGIGMGARTGNLLCYNLWVPLRSSAIMVSSGAFLTC